MRAHCPLVNNYTHFIVTPYAHMHEPILIIHISGTCGIHQRLVRARFAESVFASQNPDRVERNADATETLLHAKVVYLVDRTRIERRNANDLNNRT